MVHISKLKPATQGMTVLPSPNGIVTNTDQPEATVHVEIPTEGETSTEVANPDIEDNVFLMGGDDVVAKAGHTCNFVNPLSSLAPIPVINVKEEYGNAPIEQTDRPSLNTSPKLPVYTLVTDGIREDAIKELNGIVVDVYPATWWIDLEHANNSPTWPHYRRHADHVEQAGDFNAQLGRLSSDEKRLGGMFGVRAQRTDNGERLLQLCASH
ncbi:uncharacterized protein DEA37_0007116, partial [Paragonimus westermani]